MNDNVWFDGYNYNVLNAIYAALDKPTIIYSANSLYLAAIENASEHRNKNNICYLSVPVNNIDVEPEGIQACIDNDVKVSAYFANTETAYRNQVASYISVTTTDYFNPCNYYD